MDNKNIIFNCTLDQYNKKYRNRRYRLLKYTKKQVEDFDKQYGHYIFNSKTYTLEFNNYLLKDRKWALIGDTYYEIPKPIRYTWFRNLSAGVQAISCLVGAGVVATAVAVPTVISLKNNKGDDPEPGPIDPDPQVDVLPDYLTLGEDGVISIKDGKQSELINLNLKTKYKVNGKIVNVTKVGDFQNCVNLKTVNLPETIISINKGFNGCTSLEEINIPKNLTSIAESGAFGSCSQIKFVVETGNSKFKADLNDKCLFEVSNDTKIGLVAYPSADNTFDINTYSDLTKIYGHALEGTNLTSTINLSSNTQLTFIGDGAFASSGIQDITFPDSLINIGKGVCESCNLSNVTFPNNSYWYVQNGTETIPAYEPSLDKLQTTISYLKSSVASLSKEVVMENKFIYHLEDSKSQEDVEKGDNYSEATYLSIPGYNEGVIIRNISNNGYNESTKLKTINLEAPENILSIGSNAFKNCESLVTIDLSDCENLQIIKESAFENCNSLKDISIPNSVSEVSLNAFANTSLENVSFPNNSKWLVKDSSGSTVVDNYDPSLSKEQTKIYLNSGYQFVRIYEEREKFKSLFRKYCNNYLDDPFQYRSLNISKFVRQGSELTCTDVYYGIGYDFNDFDSCDVICEGSGAACISGPTYQKEMTDDKLLTTGSAQYKFNNDGSIEYINNDITPASMNDLRYFKMLSNGIVVKYDGGQRFSGQSSFSFEIEITGEKIGYGKTTNLPAYSSDTDRIDFPSCVYYKNCEYKYNVVMMKNRGIVSFGSPTGKKIPDYSSLTINFGGSDRNYTINEDRTKIIMDETLTTFPALLSVTIKSSTNYGPYNLTCYQVGDL